MVAPHSIPLERDGMRGGKSELHRAGWSVMRTVPCDVAVTLTSQGVRKVPQKGYRPAFGGIRVKR